jgi:hypothetical protein
MEGGWIVSRTAIFLGDQPIPLPPEAAAVDLGALLPSIDGRPLEAVFEGYAASTGEGRSSDLARALTLVLAALAELDLLT